MRCSLLCGAAFGVLLAAGLGADAQAKSHHRRAAAAPAATRAEIETLTDAVSTLEQRLNDETAARQATEARAQAAEAKADAAEADAQAARSQLQSQIQTIPGEISTAVSANKPKPSWADGTKLSATVFADASNISQTPTPNKINGAGADIKRAYIIIDHTFSPIYSANVTFDLAPNGIVLNGGTFGTGTLQGSEAVKYAYVQGKYADAFVLQLGAAKTPWIPFVEDLYGYRYIDKVMIDQNKFGNSSDWGINAHGDFGKGLFDYSISVVDGAGYKNPVRSNQVDVEGRVNVNYMGFVGALGGYSGKLSNDLQGGVTTQTASRWDALLAYTNKQLRLGVEYFQADNWKTVPGAAAIAAVAPTIVTGPCTVAGVPETCSITTNPGSAAVAAVAPKPDRAQGWSVFGSYNFDPQWSVFARYDALDPSMKLAPMERYQYFNIGVGYEPVKTVDIALVYKNESIRHAAKGGYSDGTTVLAPSSTGTTKTSGDFNEVGVYTQFKF